MLATILQPEINLIHPVCLQEANHLCKQLELAQLATDKFVGCEISFSDFLELMELAEVNIDDYLLTIENNLLEVGASI